MSVHDFIGRVAARKLNAILSRSETAGRHLFLHDSQDPQLASAIARRVAADVGSSGGVEVMVHPHLATGVVAPAQVNDRSVAYFRNRARPGLRLSLCCLPTAEARQIEATTRHNGRIDIAWFTDDPAAWADEALPSSSELVRSHLRTALTGLLSARQVVDLVIFAEFVLHAATLIETGGDKVENAVRTAMPTLRLPSHGGDGKVKLTEDSEAAKAFFRGAYGLQAFLYCREKDEPLNRNEMLRRLEAAEPEVPDAARSTARSALRALFEDKRVGIDPWTATQQTVAEIPWSQIEPFFGGAKRKAKPKLGEETLHFFERRAPDVLTGDERDMLASLAGTNSDVTAQIDSFYADHASLLQSEPSLARKWERLVFRKPIEHEDLLTGLLLLAHQAHPDVDEEDDEEEARILVIRLRRAHGLDFWQKETNTRIARFLQGRYRGLDRLLAPRVRLDFGICWSDRWDGEKTVDAVTKNAVELEFEAFIVRERDVPDALKAKVQVGKASRAKFIWKPEVEAVGLSFNEDLRWLAKDGVGSVPLLSGQVAQQIVGRSRSAFVADVANRATFRDVFKQSEGALANTGEQDWRMEAEFRASLLELESDGILTRVQADAVSAAFETFHASYATAILDLLGPEGVGSASLLEQAERYGDLLDVLAREATQEVCFELLWRPMLRIGVLSIDGTEHPAAVVAGWQPLRLAEMAAKALQLRDALHALLNGSAENRSGLAKFVEDAADNISVTYFADVALGPKNKDGRYVLLSETRTVADCSLLRSIDGAKTALASEPADGVVKAYAKVADRYLDLRPHEKANFSTVILNAEAEDLPARMAADLSARVDRDKDLRCDLVVSDDDPERLRQVYENQNRRLAQDFDASFASEAARSFLSRLRVGILPADSLVGTDGSKGHDIIVLQDVIARNSTVRWRREEAVSPRMGLTSFLPTRQSKRKPFKLGDTTTGLYLTAPLQPAACSSYATAIHDVVMLEASRPNVCWLPVQEVEFGARQIKKLLDDAHSQGNWVMTFDRVADRRLVGIRSERRIIQYFSVPRSVHNVIVSAELTSSDLGGKLHDDLQFALAGAAAADHERLVKEVYRRAAHLSGGILMRAMQWSNYARDCLGLVLSQREVEAMLAGRGENRTGWFHLDDYSAWLDLDGQVADILAMDFSIKDGVPKLQLVVVEAKYVSETKLQEQRRRSLGQLERTCATLEHRFGGNSTTMDAEIWRNRLSDMVLEHMEPFEQVGGIPQETWIEMLRSGELGIEVSGHSLVFAYDLKSSSSIECSVPDEHKPLEQRARLAQWLFPSSETASSMRALTQSDAPSRIHVPSIWPTYSSWLDTAPAVAGDRTETAGSAAKNAAIVIDAEPEAPRYSIGSTSAFIEPAAGPSSIAAIRGTEPTFQEATGGGSPFVEAEDHVWEREIQLALADMARGQDDLAAQEWLQGRVDALRSALQVEGVSAPIRSRRLTPNSALVYVGATELKMGWLERKRTDLLTRHGVEISRIEPKPGMIGIGIRRPERAVMTIADAWLRRRASSNSGTAWRFAPLLGEREDDGSLCYLPLAERIDSQAKAAPHTLISGSTGSGKGILLTNLILDLCALNAPGSLDLHLIDPKRGLDYAWTSNLPHLKSGIVGDKEEAVVLFQGLVEQMEARYELIGALNCRNLDHYNSRVPVESRLSRVVVMFDEVADWMQDADFKDAVEALLNRIALKARAAGFHLFMVYQRADVQVMTMQLRNNLGNKLILRLADEGSSRIALGEKGADRLLGDGHMIAKLNTDDKTYLQVPFVSEDEAELLAQAIGRAWRRDRR